MNRLRRRLSTLRNLPFADQWLVAQTLVLLPGVAGVNRVLGFKRTHRLLAATSERAFQRQRAARAVVDVRRAAVLVQATARRGPWRANCLQRSMVLWWALRRRGVESSLRFGVRPPLPGGAPGFHAWLELHGHVLNDRPDIAESHLPFDGPIGSVKWN